MKDILERFLSYVAFDTQSSYDSDTVPSTNGQRVLGAALLAECKEIGFDEAVFSDDGYVYCFLKGTKSAKGKKSIGFISHMDTSPDAKGSGIKTNIVKNYDGGDIALGAGRALSPERFPELKDYIGEDIITTDGATLLGADDKAGIAAIMTAVEQIIESKEERPDIYVAFTPDEEVGRGMDHFDLNIFKADYAFTIDGGKIGELEYESFNAAIATVTIKGESVHPGFAKGIMVNAVLLAAELIEMLPKDEAPATTEGYEGYYHASSVTGTVESASLVIMIRDFDKAQFESRKKTVEQLVEKMKSTYGDRLGLEIKDQYYNMGEIISKDLEIVELAKRAFEKAGVKPIIQPIRGGTDGSRLSFMGILCPNIFAGGHNFHGPYEFLPISSMEKAAEVIKNIVLSI